jgi:hypothetical protein
MGGDEQAGDQRRQSQFDDHHPVDRRGHQHHDRAERGLHQPQPDDAGPAEGVPRPHGHPGAWRQGACQHGEGMAMGANQVVVSSSRTTVGWALRMGRG